MPINTYVAIDTKTISTAATSVEFTSVPQGYTDLILVANISTVSDGEGISFQVGNGTIDTNTNYSRTVMSGANDTNVASFRQSSQSNVSMQYAIGTGSDQPSVYQVHFMDYSNATTHKTFLVNASTNRGTSTGKKETMRQVALWRSTSAIDRIKVTTTVNMNVGSTFTLYGVASTANVTGTAKATGGTITYDTYGNVFHTFTSSGTFTPSSAISVDYLVVAGGGGGAGGFATGAGGGGGGAGGFRYGVGLSCASGTGLTVTIGAGGNGDTNPQAGAYGSDGNNSVFSSITSTGGGGGGGYNLEGRTGGSGGGGGNTTKAGGLGNAGNFVPAEGFRGGAGNDYTAGTNSATGGGAGAGATGGNATNGSGTGPSGGSGLVWTGNGLYYAGGGGGGGGTSGGAGGSGGGGAGKAPGGGTGTAGTANTGGGGGGNYVTNGGQQYGGAGGSGVVIIKYSGV